MKMNQGGGELDVRIHKKFHQPDGTASPLRLSSSGHCTRKLAYKKVLPEVEDDISARAYSIFMLGDVLHDVERNLISQVADLHSQELKMHFKVDDTLEVPGHCDGILELAHGPALLDIKTTNDRGFSEMLRTGVSYEYRAQVNAYMDAAGVREGYLWVYNKNTSDRAVLEVDYDERLVEEVRTRFRRAADATLETLPPRDYDYREQISKGQPTGLDYLPYQCTYCPYTQPCWGPEGFVEVLEKGKPRWIRTPMLELDV